ncbi:MAG: hydrogenase maturation nickel metallochaperone HypA [Planctomycetota bacterium]
MHEFSLATALIKQLEKVAGEHQLARVLAADVVCGVMQQVMPEALQVAFEAASVGTVAEGAKLTIVEERLIVRCRNCGAKHPAEVDNLVCPVCLLADAEILAGRDIVLQSILGEGSANAEPTHRGGES